MDKKNNGSRDPGTQKVPTRGEIRALAVQARERGSSSGDTSANRVSKPVGTLQSQEPLARKDLAEANRVDTQPIVAGRQASSDKANAHVAVYLDGAEMPIEDVRVVIESEANQHVKMILTGFLSAVQYAEYLKRVGSYTQIRVEHIANGQPTLQYEGVIVKIGTAAEGASNNSAIHHVSVEAFSHSYLLDVVQKSRSFQNKEMEYSELLSKVFSDYQGANFIDTAHGKLNAFVLQYQETDWSFLRREASKFEQGLYADSRFTTPKIYFGMPQGIKRGELENFEYAVSRDLSTYRADKENALIADAVEFDYMTYEITDAFATDTFFLGDQLSYMGMALSIFKVVSTIKDHQLYNTYVLKTRNGLRHPRQYSKNQQGASLIGKVIAVENNLLKVHLDIDVAQSVDEAYWFDYATCHSTFYCMPELGDYVMLNCPTNDAKDAIITTSIKQDPGGGFARNNHVVAPDSSAQAGPINFAESAANPDVKLLTTKSGRMLQLGPDNITVLFDADTYLVLDDANGITLHTTQDISLHAKGQIQAVAEEEMILMAGTKITVRNRESSIELNPAQITVHSLDVRMN